MIAWYIRRPTMLALHLRSSATLACVLAASFVATPCRAQEAPEASLLTTATAEGVREGFGGAVDRIVRSQLDALDVVNVRGAVALDIEEVQLALGCVGETPECLAQVAEQVGVQVLILPNLDRAGDELVLSVARFDARGGDIRRVVRRAGGDDAETRILDSVDGLLRELFDLPPPPVDEIAERRDGTPIETPSPARGPEVVLPSIVLGAGVLTLASAIIPAVLFQGEADAYAVPPATPEEAAAREANRASAEDLALAANAMFVTGGVIAAAGLVWLVVEIVSAGSGSGESQTALVAPLVGPGLAGLSVSGRIPESP